MLSKLSRVMYGVTLIALLATDYLLGNGFVEILRKITCKLMCFIRKSIREELKHAQILMKQDNTINLPVFMAEIIVLALAIALLKKYKKIRRKDKIDDLLQESREMLRQTNEFLDKWRLRRMNTCMHLPDEYTYLDEEPEEIRPCKLEVPILYMAIVDTLGAARSQPESGDAGDLTSRTDAALLSMTSLLDEDLEPADERVEEDRTAGSRVLWDVQEEGCCNLDE